MPNDKGVNQLTGPIELAAKMFTDQQGRLPEQIQGPQKQERRTLPPGVPLDVIYPDEEL